MKTKPIQTVRPKKLNAFKLAARRYGTLWAAKQACTLGISFEDCYIGFFGRWPRKELK